ncbi:MAG: phosphoenolpyruvate carboxylase [Saprospirales bacterium]|nr:MAG: phosphoenolpyruvate carboxylase [Saprospirales bacterium]
MSVLPYRNEVENRYLIYNSLFLNLPFQDIYQTGTLLPIFEQHCREGFEKSESPVEIITSFFKEKLPETGGEVNTDLLFRFIQYVERQIVLFDSVEDAAFGKLNKKEGPGSLINLFHRVDADGLKRNLLQHLNEFGLRIVLTAHPTQFYPGHVLGIMTDLYSAIKNNELSSIDRILQQLGRTPFVNREKPTPFDEAVSLCWYLENIFFYVIPQIISEIREQFQGEGLAFENYRLISIGFWPGGDRDGNPFVNHKISKQVALRLRETALKCYYREIRKLRRRITFNEIDQQLLKIEKGIFNAVYGNKELGYRIYEELESDLKTARQILISRHDSLFLDLLEEFFTKTKIFGFHMAILDIRQDSRKHRQLWEFFNGTGEDEFLPEKINTTEVLTSMLERKFLETSEKPEDEFLVEMINTFNSIPEIQQSNGELACNRYIISNTMGAADILAVYVMARNLIGEEALNLDIIPLFESIDFLSQAPEVMRMLYRLPEYREHLRRRNNKQTIMLGFSDGTKDGGYLQANFSIYKAKQQLTKVSREFGLEVIFFDGRGGPPSRGGGNTHAFYSSLGPEIEAGEIQLTIQGQTISTNFGNPTACKLNLEQLLTAGLENSLYPNKEKILRQKDREVLEELANLSRKAYLQLRENEKFTAYLEQLTPLRFFGKTNIGSRPVKRAGDAPMTLDDLRAIPFVGSWAQMKQNVPGYYGLASAIGDYEKRGMLNEVRSLYEHSLFFRALVENSMQSLTKAFYPATAYIGEHPEFGSLWQDIYKEYEESKRLLLEISESTELLADNPLSRKSIRIREKIILPVITIQQYALQQLLEKGNQLKEEDQLILQKLILRCMYGIINAARNAA